MNPASSWWVTFTLKKRYRIIAAVNSRVRKKTNMFGIEVNIYIDHEKRLDSKNGDTLWLDEITKDMYQFLIDFKILEDVEYLPPGWKNSTGHIIFDVKIDFPRKARRVKD